MKRLKPWDGNDISVHSWIEPGKSREYFVKIAIDKKNSPHHGRRVIAKVTREQLEGLRGAIDYQLKGGKE